MPRKKTKKAKSHPKKEDDCVTYVKLEGSTPLRKDILESAIESAELLKAWENYHKFKSDKVDYYKKLAVVLGKIEKEVNALKRHIPKMNEVDMPKEDKKPIIKAKKSVDAKKPRPLEPEFKSKLDKEIYDINSRLKKLNI
ncbi:hypothetical protein HN747_02200 [archaeon]|jgi:hypothetical protein|nr:hypothetical protein [archaeon]